MDTYVRNQTQLSPEFLAGGGDMGACIRHYNWPATALGPVESWPQSLRSVISICLNSNFPIAIYWGKDLTLLYNDSWSTISGKHPWGLGRPAKEVWPDIWEDIEPQFQKAFNGQPGGFKDALLPVQRHGYTEECYFDFTFTPVYGETGKIEGVFNAVIETTYRVINERRNSFLKNLALTISTATTFTGVYKKMIACVESDARDLPFFMLYTLQQNVPTLAATSLLPEAGYNAVAWPFEKVDATGEPLLLTNLSDYFVQVPQCFWPEPVSEACIVPLKSGAGDTTGFLVFGISSRQRFNEDYRHFIKSVVAAITTALHTILWPQQERRRADHYKALQGIYDLFDEVPFSIVVLKEEDLIIEYINQNNLDIWQLKKEDVIGRPLFEVRPDLRASAEPVHRQVYQSAQRVSFKEVPIDLLQNGKPIRRFFNSMIDPLKDDSGKIVGQLATSVEVTEQVLARQKIERSERTLNELANAMPQLVWIAAANGTVTYYNNRVNEFSGASKGANGQWHWEGMLHKDDLEATNAAWHRAVKTGGVYEAEHRIKMKDGSFRWHLSRGLPLRNEGGAIEKWFGTATDINYQKQAEEKFQYLAALTQNIADAVVGTDTFYRITSWNKGAEAIYGWKSEDVLGKTSKEVLQTVFVSPELEAASKQVLEANGCWQGEVLQKKKDGTTFNVLSSVAYLNGPDEQRSGAVAVNRDVTEPKKAAEKLSESEERFRTLAETLPQMVWVSDENGKNEYFSQQWRHYFGLTNPEEAWEQMTHPDDRASATAAYQLAFEKGGSFKNEIRLLNRDGEYRWHTSIAEPVKNAEGKIIKWVGAMTDIHEQKTATEKLEGLVKERTKELERSNEDLQQFAHVASHDLKEPVRKVRTFGSRLEAEFGSLLPDKGKLYLDRMQAAADRMFGLIDGVLNYSTINSLESSMETVDLNQIISNIESDLEVAIEQKEARIKTKKLPPVRGTAVLLNQLFYNLINNSLKFSKEGVPPVITITSKKMTGAAISEMPIEEQARTFLQVSFCDNGIGFSQQYADKIFKTFTRLNSRDKFEGTGLGLALCKKIVERHNGYIYATATEGEGACFYVLLPA